jgi:2-methylcitrate dehydratase PrpD
LDELQLLSEHLISTKWEDFAEETVAAAKMVLADTIAAMVLGNQGAEVKRLAAVSEKRDKGNFDVLGSTVQTGIYSAAFINGCGSVATEMDEGNQWSKGHPAAHVVPALLTSVQDKVECTGEQFLKALITGYEACSRFGRATTLLPDAHAHGTWGVMGSAAAVALLNEATQADFVSCVNVSSAFALPTMWVSALEGALVRNTYAGHAAEMGIRSWDLVNSGIAAAKRTIEYVFGSVVGQGFAPRELLIDLGKTWDIQLNYFKPYAFCRYAHAPIDAFGEIVEQQQIEAEAIEKIEVRTYHRAATLSNRCPHNVLSAKFSIPYALAVRFYTGKADYQSFKDEYLFDPNIRAFAEKVDVQASDELEKDYPTIMPASVTIHTNDGKSYESRCDMARGGITDRLTMDEMRRKFNDLTGAVYTSAQQDRIWNFIRQIEQQKSVAPLFELCRPYKS